MFIICTYVSRFQVFRFQDQALTPATHPYELSELCPCVHTANNAAHFKSNTCITGIQNLKKGALTSTTLFLQQTL